MRTSSLRVAMMRSIMTIALLASIATAQSLTTTFAGGNGLAGNMFDVSTLGSSVIIDDLDVNIDAGTFTVDVWAVTGGGSFEPVHGNAAAWTLIGSAPNITSAGPNLPTNLGLSMGYLIPPVTTQGLYVTCTSGSPTNYTNGTNGGGIYVSDSFLAIHEGIGKGLSGYPTTFSTTVGGGTLPFPSASSRIFNGTIYYTPVTGFSDDLYLATISAPVDSVACEFLTATETVTATFVNVGSNTVLAGSLIQIDLVVDGGAPVSEFITTPNDLLLGQSYTHTFAATANLAAPGAHTIDVTVFYGGDLDPSNDGKSKVVNSGSATTVTVFPWLENFDSTTVDNTTIPPTGWTQDQSDGSGTNSDWYFKTGTTGSVNTGPNGDHSSGSGYYAYTEDSGNFAQTNLDSPCLDLSSLIAPQMNFWFHSFNSNSTPTTNQNFLAVDVISFPGGTITMDVAGPYGHQPAANWAASTWTQGTVNLAPFAGQLIQLRFRSQTSGGSTTHDIAIDDIGVFEPVPTPGQAPQPGLAVFDIENAVNGNLAPVSTGLGGPYFTTVTQGQGFTLHFEAEAFQPIAVVYGALNPVSATYPGGIGQFDIGGPGVDVNGIPLNLAVFVNAIGWVQAGAPGFPFDALFFTKTSGQLDVGLAMPPFGLPTGTVLTTFQSAIASSSAPFVHLSNAIEVTLN